MTRYLNKTAPHIAKLNSIRRGRWHLTNAWQAWLNGNKIEANAQLQQYQQTLHAFYGPNHPQRIVVDIEQVELRKAMGEKAENIAGIKARLDAANKAFNGASALYERVAALH